jgi:hypothetical protein
MSANAQLAERYVRAASRSRWFFKGLEAKFVLASRATFAGIVAGLFFPLAGRLGLAARSTVTPRILRKMVWAGSNLGSYAMAEEAMLELGGISISARRIRRAVGQVGEQRVREREAVVKQFKELDLPQQQAGSTAVEPPQVGVIMMDGGRYQRRDHFGQKDHPAGENHWREDKVGCLLSMCGEVHESDPAPEFPEWLATSAAVAELAKNGEKTGVFETSAPVEEHPAEKPAEVNYESPDLVSREVVASGADAESFGWQLAARAWQRGFPAAQRLAFVADGAHVNWTIQAQHFSHAMPILDLMHALSYAYSAADAVQDKDAFRRWAEWIWAGEVHQVIAALSEHQRRIGKPPDDASATDPRQRVARALTYYEYHCSRMNYPEYRRLGLPLTSSHIESTIKQINRRVKGSEKFWLQATSEAVLQLRADYLSDSAPLVSFWLRHQARQTGANAYTLTT